MALGTAMVGLRDVGALGRVVRRGRYGPAVLAWSAIIVLMVAKPGL